MKIALELVAAALKKYDVDAKTGRSVIEDLQIEAQPDPTDEDKAPPVKKQYAILVSDPEGLMPKNDLVGWVLQLPESDSVATIQDRIYRTADLFNMTKKGQMFPVQSVGSALEDVPAKFFKESELWVKTKTPVLVLRCDNKIAKAG